MPFNIPGTRTARNIDYDDRMTNLLYSTSEYHYNNVAVTIGVNKTVTLKDKVSSVAVATDAGETIGAELVNLDSKKADEYDVSGGVVVKKIREGGKLSQTKMDEGFVITSVNGRSIKSIEELSRILNSAVGTVKLEGFYPGFRGNYTYPLDLAD